MIRIREMSFRDIHKVYTLFISSSEETRKFFYPFPYDLRLIIILIYLAFSNKFLKYLRKLSPKLAFLSFIAINLKDQVIGFVYLRFLDNDTAKLGIMVHENFRGLGIGSRLLEYIDGIAKLMDIQEIRVNVIAENIKSIKFYMKNKYTKKNHNNKLVTLVKKL